MQTLYRKQATPPETVQSMTEIFRGSSLASIIQKSKLLIMLDEHVRSVLPPELAAHVYVMNVESHTLILGTSSAAIATRIHIMAVQLVEKIQEKQLFSHIQRIQCRVRA